MYEVSPERFQQLVSEAIDNIPKKYLDHMQNVAFIVEDWPSQAQRERLHLQPNQTLFGLYEGVPLPQRGGNSNMLLPDKITIFKRPMEFSSSSMVELKDRVGRTVWHEVAHYYGLDHVRIYALEQQEDSNSHNTGQSS